MLSPHIKNHHLISVIRIYQSSIYPRGRSCSVHLEWKLSSLSPCTHLNILCIRKWLELISTPFIHETTFLYIELCPNKFCATLQIHSFKVFYINSFSCFLINWYCLYKCILRALIRYTYILIFLSLIEFRSFILDFPSCIYVNKHCYILKLLICVVFCVFASVFIDRLLSFSLAPWGVPFPCFAFCLFYFIFFSP